MINRNNKNKNDKYIFDSLQSQFDNHEAGTRPLSIQMNGRLAFHSFRNPRRDGLALHFITNSFFSDFAFFLLLLLLRLGVFLWLFWGFGGFGSLGWSFLGLSFLGFFCVF